MPHTVHLIFKIVPLAGSCLARVNAFHQEISRVQYISDCVIIETEVLSRVSPSPAGCGEELSSLKECFSAPITTNALRASVQGFPASKTKN